MDHHRQRLFSLLRLASPASTRIGKPLNQLLNSRWSRRALAIVAGALLGLSFPRANVAGLAWIVPALMLFAARGGHAFRLGYLAGLAHYLVSLSWLLQIPVKFFPILGW